MVNAATGTLPHASAHAPARRAARRSQSASGADSVSFQSLAARNGSSARSSATMPCCWPATAMASTSRTPVERTASTSADHQRVRVLLGSRRGGGRMGRAAVGDELTGVGIAHLDLARLRRRVDAEDERHRRWLSARRAAARSRADRVVRGRSRWRPDASSSITAEPQRVEGVGPQTRSGSWARAGDRTARDLERLADLGVLGEALGPSRAGSGTCACSRVRSPRRLRRRRCDRRGRRSGACPSHPESSSSFTT